MYILQPSLLTFEQILEMEPQNRLRKIFSTLDLSPIIKSFGVGSKYGPKGYPVEAMLRALVARHSEGIPNTAKLVERLKYDPAFRYYCGFNAYGNVPSEATFSRLLAKLAENQGHVALFEDLVARGRKLGIIGSEVVAIDSTQIDAYEKKRPRKDLPRDGKSADWGSKRDTNGNQIAWFGYKTHISCDGKSELPVAVKTTPANVHDSEMAIPLIKNVVSPLVPEQNPKYWVMDMAYDTEDLYRVIESAYHGQAIIPLNLRNAKDPPEGFTFEGTPVCSMGYQMIYWGHDAKTGTNKFRCPHVLGKIECPQGSCWCSASSYGMVVKTRLEDDPRRFCAPHRGTRNWQQLYNQRTSVERCFSRLKGNLGLNNLTTRGIAKVELHQYLACITLLAATLALHQVGSAAQIAA